MENMEKMENINQGRWLKTLYLWFKTLYLWLKTLKNRSKVIAAQIFSIKYPQGVDPEEPSGYTGAAKSFFWAKTVRSHKTIMLLGLRGAIKNCFFFTFSQKTETPLHLFWPPQFFSDKDFFNSVQTPPPFSAKNGKKLPVFYIKPPFFFGKLCQKVW